mmetsp:Transcript_11649/g.42583  ORF Transcript_11649/g.42583 Transcript_11649/m.42583 type:complete len:224 (-) Transcript_11649:3146-3817(-)
MSANTMHALSTLSTTRSPVCSLFAIENGNAFMRRFLCNTKALWLCQITKISKTMQHKPFGIANASISHNGMPCLPQSWCSMRSLPLATVDISRSEPSQSATHTSATAVPPLDLHTFCPMPSRFPARLSAYVPWAKELTFRYAVDCPRMVMAAPSHRAALSSIVHPSQCRSPGTSASPTRYTAPPLCAKLLTIVTSERCNCALSTNTAPPPPTAVFPSILALAT